MGKKKSFHSQQIMPGRVKVEIKDEIGNNVCIIEEKKTL